MAFASATPTSAFAISRRFTARGLRGSGSIPRLNDLRSSLSAAKARAPPPRPQGFLDPRVASLRTSGPGPGFTGMPAQLDTALSANSCSVPSPTPWNRTRRRAGRGVSVRIDRPRKLANRPTTGAFSASISGSPDRCSDHISISLSSPFVRRSSRIGKNRAQTRRLPLNGKLATFAPRCASSSQASSRVSSPGARRRRAV